jgi:hypothetical protein
VDGHERFAPREGPGFTFIRLALDQRQTLE